jgi:hypothetical protein
MIDSVFSLINQETQSAEMKKKENNTSVDITQKEISLPLVLLYTERTN